jgi:hypothetical protein
MAQVCSPGSVSADWAFGGPAAGTHLAECARRAAARNPIYDDADDTPMSWVYILDMSGVAVAYFSSSDDSMTTKTK